MAKTISAYVDEETAQRIERLSKVEQRPVSQLAAAALAFYAQLPAPAHAALRLIEALGGTGDSDRVVHEVTRVLLEAQYQIAQRAAVSAMRVDRDLDVMTDEDLLGEAVHTTVAAPRGVGRAGKLALKSSPKPASPASGARRRRA